MNNKRIDFLLIILLLVVFSACQKEEEKTGNSTTASMTPVQTGIDFANTLTETSDLNIIEYLYYYNGGGVAIGDIDNDGLEDIYFTANQGPDKLYRNLGDLKFEDISIQAGVMADSTWSSGVAMADVNNDGYVDVHVCKVGTGKLPEAHNLLYINQQDGTFKEQSAELGVNVQGYSTQAAFLDYDEDGDLDMYLLNHNVHSVRSYGSAKIRQEKDAYAGDRFFENRLNEAEQAFVDVTEQSGIYSSPLGYGLAVSCADINGDGLTDIYVGNDFHENDYLYINNGDKTFTERISEWTDHTTQFSMSVDIADLNNDGLPDIFSTDMLPFDEEVYLKSGGEDTDQVKRIKDNLGFSEQFARNHLQLNTGLDQFIEIALKTRTFATDWSWAVLLQDFDNNGQKDIFITNGIVKRPNDLDYINYLNSEAVANLSADNPERTQKLIAQLPSEKLKNILFLQSEGLTFSEVNESQVGAAGFSNGAAYADLDGDGFLEIVINNINEPATVLTPTKKSEESNYLQLALRDPSRKTINGTKVYLHTAHAVVYQEVQSVKGYQSSSSPVIHMGLGANTQIDSLLLIWPDNSKQLLRSVKLNSRMEVVKESGLPVVNLDKPSVGAEEFSLLPLRHQENEFNDDENEKLILEKLSREGPAALYEDLNGDGIKDVLLGGAHSQATRLLQGKKDGSFEVLAVEDFTRDARYEDVSVATIDFDGDGDKDLYIASGGSVARELDKVLEDRLYLNNGNMDFRRIPLSLPHTNASVVTVADYNDDGYEDIFVGARSMPGYYGLSPYSFLLTNQGGMGVEIAYQHRFGMVTDATWADYDADNDLDLILCGDWMPVTILENKGGGEMEFLAEEKNFPALNGFWNTLKLKDLNQDGKLDILAGNMGLNGLLQPTEEHPVKLYLGDFDENGTVDPLVFFTYFNRYVPLGSKDKLLSQLPGLKKNFISYADYAKVRSFEELLPEGDAQLVETKEVTEVRSMVFLSGDTGYKAVPMPDVVQELNVQHLHVDKQNKWLYYLGGTQEWVAVQGNFMASKAGRLSLSDEGEQLFAAHERIRLPSGINGRQMIQLDNGSIVIITNNDYPYFLNTTVK